MRKLTLVRKKSFIGCACRVYVYRTVAEGEEPQIVLGGLPCVLASKLKNGKSEEIEIPDADATVWVSNSRTFPDSYKAGFQYPAGAEPGTLYMKMKFSPFEGNPVVLSTNPL